MARENVQSTAAEFNKNNYDNILVRVPKGTKNKWQDAADKSKMALNRWIVNACTAYLGEEKKEFNGYGSAILDDLKPETAQFIQKNPSVYHSIMAMIAREKVEKVDKEVIDTYMKRSGVKKFHLTDDDREYVKEIMNLCIKRRAK